MRNGRRRPPRPQIRMVTPAASESDAVAIVAAIERFLAETAPTPAPVETKNPWQQAALAEGISARQVTARSWG